jgi:hypothetical protein
MTSIGGNKSTRDLTIVDLPVPLFKLKIIYFCSGTLNENSYRKAPFHFIKIYIDYIKLQNKLSFPE